jgi:hypothetical protein
MEEKNKNVLFLSGKQLSFLNPQLIPIEKDCQQGVSVFISLTCFHPPLQSFNNLPILNNFKRSN